MDKHIYLAVDLGAESGRVIAGTLDGDKLELEEMHRFANVPVRVLDSLQWDILRLWNDIQDGLQKSATKYGGTFNGIGVDTWGVDFGLLDANDDLLGNPTHYRDKRNEGMMDKAFESVAREDIYSTTGLQFLPFNSLYQLVAMREKSSPQLEIAKSLLLIPDLLHFWLCGVKASEYSIASTSQMLDASTRGWSEDLLRKLDLPTTMLPDVVSPGTVLGHVREDLAQRLGIEASTPVIVPGSHDTASAIAAVPVSSSDEQWAYLSSGTWSLMGIELDEPLITQQTRELGFTNEGGVAGTIRFLKNIAGLWLVQECRRSFARAGREFSYDDLTQRAAGARPLKCFVEPDDASFVAPADMPQAIRDYCQRTGQEVPQGAGETVRCCLDSLALKYRKTLESLETLRGERIETLYIVGGGTQNKLLSRLTADCLGRKVIAGPIEATAIGNILTQAMARGAVKNLAHLREIVASSFSLETFEADAHAKTDWDQAYEKFLQLGS
jgi:rhamnulokinase